MRTRAFETRFGSNETDFVGDEFLEFEMTTCEAMPSMSTGGVRSIFVGDGEAGRGKTRTGGAATFLLLSLLFCIFFFLNYDFYQEK